MGDQIDRYRFWRSYVREYLNHFPCILIGGALRPFDALDSIDTLPAHDDKYRWSSAEPSDIFMSYVEEIGLEIQPADIWAVDQYMAASLSHAAAAKAFSQSAIAKPDWVSKLTAFFSNPPPDAPDSAYYAVQGTNGIFELGFKVRVNSQSTGLTILYSPAYFVTTNLRFGSSRSTPVESVIPSGRFIFGARVDGASKLEPYEYDVPPTAEVDLTSL